MLVYQLSLTFGALQSLLKEFWLGTTLKLPENLFRYSNWGLIFLKLKDPVLREQRVDSVYSIPCKDCEHAYIG